MAGSPTDPLALPEQVRRHAAADDAREAVKRFSAEVREGRYPGPEHSFGK